MLTPNSYGYFIPDSDDIRDCTTWEWYYEKGDYDYVGFKCSGGAVSPVTEKKTFLVKSETAAVQTFAFEMDDID